MPWHESFRSMRGVTAARDWMTFGEMREQIRAEGFSFLTDWEIRQAAAVAPAPAMVYGMKRYMPVHVEAVRAYAAAAVPAITTEGP